MLTTTGTDLTSATGSTAGQWRCPISISLTWKICLEINEKIIWILERKSEYLLYVFIRVFRQGGYAGASG